MDGVEDKLGISSTSQQIIDSHRKTLRYSRLVLPEVAGKNVNGFTSDFSRYNIKSFVYECYKKIDSSFLEETF